MSRDAEQLKRALIDKTKKAVSRGKGGKAPAAKRFADAYFANVSPQDCADIDSDCMIGATKSLWAFAQMRKPGVSKVRAFNPTVKKEGWACDHTVIEIVNDDMPFLVDSVTAELNHRDYTVHLLIHPVMPIKRTGAGSLSDVARGTDATPPKPESLMHIQITEQKEASELRKLEKALEKVLRDVRAAVDDWRPMRVAVADVIAELDATTTGANHEETAEAAAFLRWLDDNNFTFLGYREYALSGTSGKRKITVIPKSGLGLLRNKRVSVIEGLEDGATLPPDLAAFLSRPSVTLINKANRRSTVHRGVHLDAIFIKRFDDKGKAVGHRLFVGLFTSTVYSQPVHSIPVIRRKVERLVRTVGFSPVSHDGKALIHILESLPRDELFQIGEAELRRTALGILHLQERQRTALFIRRDPFGRYVSCLVYVPRDRYDTRLRQRIQDVLEAGFGGQVTAFYTQLSDEVLARLHYIVKTSPGSKFKKTVDGIQDDVIHAARDWSDDLAQSLSGAHGESTGLSIYDRYRSAFPAIYRDRFDTTVAVSDIAKIEAALSTRDIAMDLYRPDGAPESEIRFKVFNCSDPLPLSDVLPMLENMGLRVIDEVPHQVRISDDECVWIHDFGMVSRGGQAIGLAKTKPLFEETFERVWHDRIEDDGFNGLVIAGGMTPREIVILRAYSKYLRQAGIPFSQNYMEETLARNCGIAGDIVALFERLFDPDPPQRAPSADAIRKRLNAALDDVQNLDEDRILRRFLNLVEATLRTNYYQRDDDGNPKAYVSFKFDSRKIDDLPLPRPLREIFVYSPRMEGVHLRGGPVARGGIRWSDRREDFRTEILGLMKAQMTKNAVIVPVGAKGGFVLKRPPTTGGRAAFLEEGVTCYKMLIWGMLDITDNLVSGKPVPPERVVRRDDDDPYLVVAADKGTATFSDIANGVARDYGFWLDDAFASGGSAGYDHKKMGITARGAWESVKRHFREMGIDTQKDDFTVVGVGDMSGDVFGNGMLLSKHIKLIGAFNHLHVFVDPNPDPAKSWKERDRLFRKGQSSWSDYDARLISKGGGIFERSSKSIRLTPEMRDAFDLPNKDSVPPNELLRAIILSKADLMWFGGIGTYVKSSDESNSEVGDRVNDPLRVNGEDLRCKVIGEGANLAITQLGRIEYALSGGRINTDFIDNSAGVASSDHEVNIKILFGEAIAADKIDLKARNKLLVEMTDDVAEHVLMDNYRQSMAISHVEAQAAENLAQSARFIRALERSGELDRSVEFLPDDDELAEREMRKQGLTRPEIAVLLAYAKMTLYDDLLASDVPDDPWLTRDIGLYFPDALRRKFGEFLPRHRLRREITATYITNSLVNRAGPTFVNEIANETGAQPDRIATAYLICRRVFGLRDYWAKIEALDNVIPAEVQTTLNLEIRRLIRRGTIWFVEKIDRALDVQKSVEQFEPGIAALTKSLDSHLSPELEKKVAEETTHYAELGVPESLARGIASLDVLFAGCDIVRIANRSNENVGAAARVYFAIGARYGFDWLRDSAERIAAESEWQAMAVSAIIDELYDQQARLTGRIFDTAGGAAVADAVTEAWQETRKHEIARLNGTIEDMHRASSPDLAMLAVATRHIRALIDD